MIAIRAANSADFQIIQEIAWATWPNTYKGIISDEQIQYMLDLFYSVDALKDSVLDGHIYYVAEIDSVAAGFCGFQHHIEPGVTKIHKLYVLPEFQGRSIGKKLVEKVEHATQSVKSSRIILNVNRANPAQNFYRNLGFTIAYKEDIPLEHGYFMNDYVMEKLIPQV